MTEQSYSWQIAYRGAVLETDPAALPGKVLEAVSACEQRRLSPIDADEAKALAEAEQVLRMLQNEQPDSSNPQN
jgi:hypothetical protein